MTPAIQKKVEDFLEGTLVPEGQPYVLCVLPKVSETRRSRSETESYEIGNFSCVSSISDPRVAAETMIALGTLWLNRLNS